jgi:hypothetical protein
VTRALDALYGRLDNAADTQQRFSDQVNRGATVYNAGDTRGSEAIFQNEVSTTLTELTRRQEEVRAALAALHDARDDLEEVLQ